MNKEDAVKILSFPVKLYGTAKDTENLDALKLLLTNWNGVYPDHAIVEINYSDNQVYLYLDFMTSVEGYHEIEGMVYTAFEIFIPTVKYELVKEFMLQNATGKRVKYEVLSNGVSKYAFVTVYQSTPDIHVNNYEDLPLHEGKSVEEQVTSHFDSL